MHASLTLRPDPVLHAAAVLTMAFEAPLSACGYQHEIEINRPASLFYRAVFFNIKGNVKTAETSVYSECVNIIHMPLSHSHIY